MQQALAFLLLGGDKGFDADVWGVAGFDCTHEVKHDGVMDDGVDDHLLLFFVQHAKGLDDVVTCLAQEFGVIVFFQDALLFDVCLEEIFFAIGAVKAVKRVQRYSLWRQSNAFGYQVHMIFEPALKELLGLLAVGKL